MVNYVTVVQVGSYKYLINLVNSFSWDIRQHVFGNSNTFTCNGNFLGNMFRECYFGVQVKAMVFMISSTAYFLVVKL